MILLRKYFSFVGGVYEIHATERKARDRAQIGVMSYRNHANRDDAPKPQNVETVSWGEVRGQAYLGEKGTPTLFDFPHKQDTKT